VIQIDKKAVLLRERVEAWWSLLSYAGILILCIVNDGIAVTIAEIVAGGWAVVWLMKVLAVTADLHQQELD